MKTQAEPSLQFSPANRRGFVLPTVVFSITVMSMVVVAALTTSTDERRASRAVRESTLAVYAAEAGLRQTYGSWPVAAVDALAPGDSLDLGWQNLANNAQYRTVIHRMDNGGLQQYNVVVQGRRTGLNGGLSTIVGVVSGVPLFSRAVYAEQLIHLTGGGPLDGFDSDVGPYVAATADSSANIATNGNLEISSKTVKGNARVGGSIAWGWGGNVTGTTTSGVPPVDPYEVVPCPATGYTPASKIPVGGGVSYNAVTGSLFLTSGATLDLTDSAYFFSSVVVVGGAELAAKGDPRVHLYVRDSMHVAGGTIFNGGNSAADLAITGCGTPTNPAKTNYWGIAGGPRAYFSIYAPTQIIYTIGNGDIYGAIISKVFYTNTGLKLHYDAALARQPSRKLVVQKGSWAQLAGQ